MAKGRRPLSVQELSSHFSTDDAGDLFWKGEKIRTGGWTVTNRLAFFALLTAIFSAVLSFVTNFAAIKLNAGSLGTYIRSLLP